MSCFFFENLLAGWLSAALLGWEANDFFDAVASAEDAYGHTAVAKHAQQCLAEQVRWKHANARYLHCSVAC